MNVTAGIGILEQASPMIQELFRGRITATAAAGFVALLSLFNMGGRFIWSSVSDYIGRKNTYYVFFVLGAVLYYLAPRTGVSGMNSVPLFVIISAVIVSMYGGGFATVPAYLRDLFGTMEVGAIHGRLLTAGLWRAFAGPCSSTTSANMRRTAAFRWPIPTPQFYTSWLDCWWSDWWPMPLCAR